MPGPLTGVRVLDLSRVLSGPACTQFLVDLGAEVLKIEDPREGDAKVRDVGTKIGGMSAYFATINRSKRSVTVDFKQAEGQAILRKLAARCDVLVENFRPGVTKAFGLDFASLRPINPGLIYCGISGFGQTGPAAQRPAFDQILQGMSGLMSITGDARTAPMRVGLPLTDTLAGMFAAYGIVAALYTRERTGEGQEVFTSLLEAGVGILSFRAAEYFATGQNPELTGNDHPMVAPHGTFGVKDGHVNLCPVGEAMWRKLCEVLDLRELADDPRFAHNRERIRRRAEITGIVQAKLLTRTMAEWTEFFNAAGIPCGPIYQMDQVFQDPQVLHQEMVRPTEDARGRKLTVLGCPVKFSGTPLDPPGPAPELGEHTDAVLEELGYSAADIARLRSQGVI